MTTMRRVPYGEVVQVFTAKLIAAGMLPGRSARCACLFADASRDGVPSHGLNRFAGFVRAIQQELVQPNADPRRIAGEGLALERWDGQDGAGPLNAEACMDRAIALARQFGIGAVALGRTNHWMRAGNYGWQAANAGCIGICWTNATATMAPWGGRGRIIGNNPLVLAVPRENGQHLVLDMAMSQYSMGKLGVMTRAGEKAPLPAGFDASGSITHEPAAVLEGGTAMPIGYWKGSGLAMLLDVIAAALGGGLATWQLEHGKADQGVSQFFLALDPAKIGAAVGTVVEGVIGSIQTTGEGVLYPGERTLKTRNLSMKVGVEVDAALWEEVLALRG